MSAPPLSVDAVLDRLALGPWRLIGLPTIHGSGLYFIALRPGYDSDYAWLSLDAHGAASRTTFFDRPGAAAFLREYERDGYTDALLRPWQAEADPAPATLRAALSRARRLLDELRAHPDELLVPAMGEGWLERSEDVGWVVTKVYDSGPSRIHCDEARAASELLTQILRHDPELEPGTPPAELAAEIQAERARRAEVFAAHGPRPARLFLRSREGAPARGFMRFADGVHALIELDEQGQLRRAELWPTDAAFALIFRDEQGVLPSRSQPIGPELQAQLARVHDLEALAQWHHGGGVRLRCGSFARGGFETLDADTLLDDLRDQRLSVRAALERFMGGRGYVEVELREQVPPSVEARAEDDPNSPKLRYLFPKVWLRRLSRERVFELGYGAALRAALGSDAAPQRSEEPIERGEWRHGGRRITLGLGEAAVTITEEPIESGHGVHGEQVHASFRGLPEGLRLTGSGRVDMRGGGHLELEVDAEDPQLARAIKAAVLAALP